MLKKAEAGLSLFIRIIAIIFALFSVTISVFPYDVVQARTIHLMFILPVFYLLEGVLKAKKWNAFSVLLNSFCAIAGVVACWYLISESFAIQTERMGIPSVADMVFAFILMAVLIFATYRLFGWTFIIIIGICIAYLLFGNKLPALWGHPGVSLKRAIGSLVFYTEGIFGAPLGSATSIIACFMIFAAFLEVGGGSNLFMDIALGVFGRFTGGAAKVAVIASSLFGTISGSAAANVAGTGIVTIPLMKKTGFEPHVAGAVEAVASTGGQIMPPVMGAAAFVMAEMLGVSYSVVMFAALVPAIMYYAAVFISVDLYARKHNIRGVENCGRLANNFNPKKLILLFPLVALIVIVGFFKSSPQRGALVALIAIFVCSFPFKEHRLNLKKILEALYKGGTAMLTISIICATCGIIVSTFAVTGLGLKLSSAMVSLAHGHMIILLLLAMLASLILGMGVPTVAAYLILVILISPALTTFGVIPIAAHLFVFYFGIIAAITPPVAIAAYVAAGIANDKPMKVGWASVLLAIPVFVVPFIFVYQPAMLLQGSLGEIIQVCVSSILGSGLCAVAVQGYLTCRLKTWERSIIFSSAILELIPEPVTDIIGAVLALSVIILSIKNKTRRDASTKQGDRL
jgi:TRAP transporter 4TM/12TM fusion protein